MRKKKSERWPIYDFVEIEGALYIGYNLTSSYTCCNDVGHKY
jgi:hypothetical protein